MSEKLKAKIGDDLYNQILAKGLKPEDLDIVNDGNWIPKSRFNEINGKLKASEAKNVDYEKQIEDTKTLLNDNEDLKNKYNDLDMKYKNDIAIKDKEIIDTSKRYLIETKLINEGARHTDLIMKTIDLDKISIENNNLLGFDDTLNSLKTNYSDLFVTKQSDTTNTGGNTGNTGNTNNSIDGIDWEEKLKDI